MRLLKGTLLELVLPWSGLQLWAYRAKSAEVLHGLGHSLAKQAHHNTACSSTRVE